MSAVAFAIERFLESSHRPAVMEPGEDPLPMVPGSYVLRPSGKGVTIEVWNDSRNLVRRVRSIQGARGNRMDLEVERFGKLTGAISIVDLAHPSSLGSERRSSRLKYREIFRRSLTRQFAGWKIVELSTETDLHHSLSPSYPRALLRKGSVGIAAIGAGQDALDADGALSFGLIWLDYLRRRESKIVIESLAIFLPAGRERTTCHRVRHLNPDAARYYVYVHDPQAGEAAVDTLDYTNFDTRVDHCKNPAPRLPVFGHPLPPEAWLESQIRASIDKVDASLLPAPVYGQVPEFAGGYRGIMDLLAVDCHGRLAIVEIKASQDVHLPLQALDYWMRVKWHLERGEFDRKGYFPAVPLRQDPPRLLLVAPALEYHPSTQTLLRYFSREVQWERFGVGLEWREELKIVFRSSGALWPSLSSVRSDRRFRT